MVAIIFCGIQATGKTTFFRERLFESHIRISLDQLNTRNKEQKFIETCVATQQPYVVDNTNPTVAERSKYIHYAKTNKFRVVGYYFQSKLDEAIVRNYQRAGKKKVPEIGIRGTYKKLKLPCFEEGFDELYYVELKNNKFIVKAWEDEV